MECKADRSLTQKSGTKILNNGLTIVSCVYEPLLQPVVIAFISKLINVN